MAYKRTTRTTGTRRLTTTVSHGNGKYKTTRSESNAAKTRPGQTRVTTTYSSGKTDTIRTTNLGQGWYQRSSKKGDARRERATMARTRKFWDGVFKTKKTRRAPKSASGASIISWAVVLAIVVAMILR